MSKTIFVKNLNAEDFKEFGEVIDIPNTPAPKTGEGWDCWNYLAMMDVSVPIGMGLVNTKERNYNVETMERHVSRDELLIPLREEIIQPVAICQDINDSEERPDSSTVQCFRIKPGQGIVIRKGVWHSPAFPVSGDTTYLFAIEKKPDKFGDEMVNPWVRFQKDEKVAFKIR